MAAVNLRIMSSKFSGVQRYAQEIVSRAEGRLIPIVPKFQGQGVRGHLWEQAILPFLLKGSALWSPSNTGPLSVSKQIVTIHDIVPIDHPEWLNSKFALWYQFLLPKLVRRIEKIISVSFFTKDRLVSRLNVPEEKIVVIHNGIDNRKFHKISQDEARLILNEWELKYKRYILSLGSLEPRKNLNRLLAAWEKSLSSKKLPNDVILVIAGSQGPAQVFKDVGISKIPERVKFTGHLDDALLPALYSGALAFFYLSEYEGFGLPPLEAMACGTVPVTGNLTALPEVVTGAGIMVNPFNIDEIVDSIFLVIDNENIRNKLEQELIIRSQKFSWDVCAEKTISIIESL